MHFKILVPGSESLMFKVKLLVLIPWPVCYTHLWIIQLLLNVCFYNLNKAQLSVVKH